MDILEAKGMKKHLRTIVSIRPSHLKREKGIKKESKGKEEEKV